MLSILKFRYFNSENSVMEVLEGSNAVIDEGKLNSRRYR